MPNRAQRVMWLYDTHGPERDPQAIAVALKAMRYFKPHKTIMGGDMLDNRAFSQHPATKLGERRKGLLLKDELDWAGKFLDTLQARTIGETIMLEGNHDEWVERMCTNLPSGLAESIHSCLSPRRFLTKDGKRKHFKWIPFRKLQGDRKNEYELPHKLVSVHGMSTSKNAAAKHLEKYRYCKSVVFGHSHRYDHVRLHLPDRRVVEAINPGCLCKLRPTYADGPTDWAHGFAVGYLGRHTYTLYGCKIERGYTVLPGGQEVRV